MIRRRRTAHEATTAARIDKLIDGGNPPMGTSKICRRLLISAPIVVSAALAVTVPATSLAAAPASAASRKAKPRAVTGGAQHVLATSALLTATISPNGIPTSYQFQYGLTTAYGQQTPLTPVGSQTTKVPVGQQVTGLQAGATYHFRVVAVTSTGEVIAGKDHIFRPKGKAKIEVPTSLTVTAGSTFILNGTLRGFGAAGRKVQLQASPYPYLESFTSIGAAGTTDAAGRFSFRVANLTTSTQFRVITLDARPLYSTATIVHAALKVTFHVKTSSTPGFVRLYGTVTPAAVGAHVYFQLLKATRPGKNEATTRYSSQFSTVAKKGGLTFSRFSIISKIIHGGSYRVFVKVKPGKFVSAYSSPITLRAGK